MRRCQETEILTTKGPRVQIPSPPPKLQSTQAVDTLAGAARIHPLHPASCLQGAAKRSIVVGMDRLPKDFVEQIVRFDEAPCDERSFRALSQQAVEIYEQHPEQGEAISQLMTGVWFSSSETWSSGREKAIGELFADLDVPPVHVVGGEQGAAAKWAAVKRLAGDK